MLRSVFAKTLRDYGRGLLWWGSGIALLVVSILAFYPSFRDLTMINEYIQAAPEALLRAFIGDVGEMTSPRGYLTTELFFFVTPLLLLIFTIGFGSAAVAGEEERGTLDLLLAHPLPRWRLVLEKFAALLVMTLALVLVLWLALLIGAPMVDMEIGSDRLTAMGVSNFLLALAFGALALAVGCASGRRGLSAGASSAVAVATYLINAFAPSVEWLEPYRVLSPFYYYIGGDPLANGLNLGHAAVLLGLTVVLLTLTLFTFERRDVAV